MERCGKCHSRAQGKRRGGLLVDTREDLLRGGDSGPAIVPGDPDASLLVRAVRQLDVELSMPPRERLRSDEVDAFARWVSDGAVFPAASTAAETTSESTLEARETRGAEHWAFRPLPELDAVADHRGRVDELLDRELAARDLPPSPEATREALVRRAWLDLAGLPPTPAAARAFIEDREPEAWEKLVDGILASPAAAERWARFWLDRARYVDRTADWLRRIENAWRYRDWVVQAFANDLPHDRFVRLQLAADEHERREREAGRRDVDPGDRAALGFLALSPEYWKELRLAPDVIRTVVAEEWEERIDTVTRTFLGLTVACARCHDHKHDPITQRDYYALAGVFASVRAVERPLLEDAAAERVLAARATLRELESALAEARKASRTEEVATLERRVEALRRRTPDLEAPVASESMWVLPDGEDATRIEWRPEPRDVAVQRRGSPSLEGEVVARRFLSFLSRGEPRAFESGSGRLELADAIIGDAGMLASRVIVNRLWAEVFGRGLVSTPSTFGAKGERPSHPELLDELAARFVAEGGSQRRLVRSLVTSAAYRRSSVTSDSVRERDPENVWLSRHVSRRLPVEVWRDSMLVAAGTLDRSIGGPARPLSDLSHRRRALYGEIHRRELAPDLRLFDFPDPTAHSEARGRSTSPLQGLYLLNGPFVAARARELAERLAREASDLARVDRGYEALFSRAPEDRERELVLAALARLRETSSPGDAWTLLAQALLLSNEFFHVP